MPGRKTDQKDAEWIAQLLQYGLLRASYIPCEIIRDLRDLTRMRACLSQEASRISSRIQKVLEDANVKLASRPLAPEELQTVLALEITRRAATAAQGNPPADRSHGEGECDLGRRAHRG